MYSFLGCAVGISRFWYTTLVQPLLFQGFILYTGKCSSLSVTSYLVFSHLALILFLPWKAFCLTRHRFPCSNFYPLTLQSQSCLCWLLSSFDCGLPTHNTTLDIHVAIGYNLLWDLSTNLVNVSPNLISFDILGFLPNIKWYGLKSVALFLIAVVSMH